MDRLKPKRKIKTRWNKPTLILLIRGESAEKLLVACKIGEGGPGPYQTDLECMTNDEIGCPDCSSMGYS
jgi:hypothetical protein